MPRPQTDEELAGRAGAARDLARYLERQARAGGRSLTATEIRRDKADAKRAAQNTTRLTPLTKKELEADAETQLSWADEPTYLDHRAVYDADLKVASCGCRACTAHNQQILQELLQPDPED